MPPDMQPGIGIIPLVCVLKICFNVPGIRHSWFYVLHFTYTKTTIWRFEPSLKARLKLSSVPICIYTISPLKLILTFPPIY